MAAPLLRTDAMTRDDHMSAERSARSFRTRVERAYKAGRINRRRVERLGTIGPSSRKLYLRELKGLIETSLRNGMTLDDVQNLRAFFRIWIKKGAPVDVKILWMPAPSWQIVVRQMATAFPGLACYTDAALWLSDPEMRAGGRPMTGPVKTPRNFTPAFQPFNCFLHAPRGTTYSEFNRVGYTKEIVDLPSEDAA